MTRPGHFHGRLFKTRTIKKAKEGSQTSADSTFAEQTFAVRPVLIRRLLSMDFMLSKSPSLSDFCRAYANNMTEITTMKSIV